MAKFAPPEAFDFTQPAEWPTRRFSRFRGASEPDKESGEVNSLLYAMERDAESIYNSFVFPAATEDNPLDFNAVMGKFDEHFERNVIHERASFHERTQQAGESVEAFVRSL